MIPVRTEQDRRRVMDAISKRPMPFVVNVKSGAPRSLEQNKLQRQWLNEAAQQGDMTAEEYRGLIKLTVGVPILRAEDAEFAAAYDQQVKPLPYEQKLALMMEPIDLPVTRRMSAKAKSEYLDQMHRYLTEQGFVLTDPDEPAVMRRMA